MLRTNLLSPRASVQQNQGHNGKDGETGRLGSAGTPQRTRFSVRTLCDAEQGGSQHARQGVRCFSLILAFEKPRKSRGSDIPVQRLGVHRPDLGETVLAFALPGLSSAPTSRLCTLKPGSFYRNIRSFRRSHRTSCAYRDHHHVELCKAFSREMTCRHD